jgi:stearoyl-CoA desaturase (delta-9 desaturase)
MPEVRRVSRPIPNGREAVEITGALGLSRLQRLVWLFHKRLLPIVVTYLGLCLAPFTFSWSGLVVAGILLLVTGLGVTVGLHRLLTHRSFATFRWVKRVLATAGTLAFQGGVIDWVAIHRLHHAYSDTDADPHTPRDNFWHGYVLWLFEYDGRIADESIKARYVPDLMRDPYLVFLETWWVGLQALLFGLLYMTGELTEPHLGLSWAVYGIFVRSAVLQQMSWLVNTASHKWGYKNAETRDRSVNCWWMALLALGEGWHNNHHACPRAARFGWRWYEWDSGFLVIRLLQALHLVWDVRLPDHRNRSHDDGPQTRIPSVQSRWLGRTAQASNAKKPNGIPFAPW